MGAALKMRDRRKAARDLIERGNGDIALRLLVGGYVRPNVTKAVAERWVAQFARSDLTRTALVDYRTFDPLPQGVLGEVLTAIGRRARTVKWWDGSSQRVEPMVTNAVRDAMKCAPATGAQREDMHIECVNGVTWLCKRDQTDYYEI